MRKDGSLGAASFRGGDLKYARDAPQSIVVSAAADDICNVAAPDNGLTLKFSIVAVVAMARLGIDTADPVAYDAATCVRTDWRDLMSRVVVKLDPSRPVGPTLVSVTLADGRIEAHEDRGTAPANLLLSAQPIGAKFAALAAPRLGRRTAARIALAIMGGAGYGRVQTAANGAVQSAAPDIPRVIRMTVPADGVESCEHESRRSNHA